MEKMRDKNGKPEKKSSRTTLIMAAGLLGILLIETYTYLWQTKSLNQHFTI